LPSLLRAVFGPSFGATRAIPVVPPPPDRPIRVDSSIELVSVDPDTWTVGLKVPPYDLATHNLLAEVRVYLLSPGAGRPGTAQDYLASSYPFESVDLRPVQNGADVVVPLPEVDPGDYFGQIVLLFDDEAATPPSEPASDPAPGDQPAPAEPPTTG